MDKNEKIIEKEYLTDACIIYAINNEWTFRVSKTDNTSDFSEEKIIDNKCIDEIFGQNNRWLRLMSGEGECMQISLLDGMNYCGNI